MAIKKYPGAPFGCQTSRFDVSGVYPSTLIPGTFTQSPYFKKHNTKENQRLGPGKYEIETGGFNAKAVMERASGPGWEQAHNSSRLAMMPHLLHKEEWKRKKLLEEHMGPGKYETKDYFQSINDKPRSTFGFIDSKEQRFREILKHEATPGPGTYGEDGIPHSKREISDKKCPSSRGLMDCGRSATRSLPTIGSHLAPGCYNLTSFTEELLNKKISSRGPYDLFSDDRNNPIKCGYSRNVVSNKLGPGEYEIKSFVDDWTSENKKIIGKFSKLHKYPKNPSERVFAASLSQFPRVEADPGPGSYVREDSMNTHSFSKDSPGFLSSSQRDDHVAKKFFLSNNNTVGVGRYKITKHQDKQHINGHNSVFRSKTSKMDGNDERYHLERIKSRNVRPEDQTLLISKDWNCNPAKAIQNTMLRTVTVA